jgi:hypothetical protein
MNRIELRHAVLEAYPEQSLLTICEHWYSILKGSVDCAYTLEELETAAHFLVVVQKTWSPCIYSGGPEYEFEDAVELIVRATLNIIAQRIRLLDKEQAHE